MPATIIASDDQAPFGAADRYVEAPVVSSVPYLVLILIAPHWAEDDNICLLTLVAVDGIGIKPHQAAALEPADHFLRGLDLVADHAGLVRDDERGTQKEYIRSSNTKRLVLLSDIP